jgi:hypothetical protein
MLILESFGDCEHLTIPDLVVTFGFIKGCKSEDDWIPERVYVIAFL